MIEYAIFVLLTFVFFYFIFNTVRLTQKNKALKVLLIQAEIDKKITQDQFNINSNNDFVSFLSKSREDAFLYIDTAQEAIKEFVEGVDKHIDYFNKYGIVLDQSPLHESMRSIAENYPKIKNLIPEHTTND